MRANLVIICILFITSLIINTIVIYLLELSLIDWWYIILFYDVIGIVTFLLFMYLCNICVRKNNNITRQTNLTQLNMVDDNAGTAGPDRHVINISVEGNNINTQHQINSIYLSNGYLENRDEYPIAVDEEDSSSDTSCSSDSSSSSDSLENEVAAVESLNINNDLSIARVVQLYSGTPMYIDRIHGEAGDV